MQRASRDIKRVVVKIGSSLFCSSGNAVDPSILNGIVREQIAKLAEDGCRVCVVCSGAKAPGKKTLGLSERPRTLAGLQAAAAVGQNALMNAFQKAMPADCHCAQVLLTWEDFTDRERWLNARGTLNRLMGSGYAGRTIIPVINENDTVSTNEIRFGDNDQLSARVACLVDADLLVILSDVDGLYDGDRKTIPVVDAITPEIRALACPTSRKTCVGGMITKLDAAKIAVDSGIPCVIANGRKAGIILDAVSSPARAGTLFLPRKKGLALRERWIAFGTKPKGSIMVDDGARRALCDHKSLLSVGIVGLDGAFGAGEIVSIVDRNGEKFAVGKTHFGSAALDKLKGRRHDREIVHRDNIVIL
ncbi:MAG: glutamate 5-kinase [Deltaproteobacteria bacterium]